MRARGGLAGEASGQVHVDEVEAARPELEVERLGRDDDVVARLGRPDEAHVGLRRACDTVDLDLEILERIVGRRGGDNRAAAQLQHEAEVSRRAKVTSSMLSRASRLTRSVGSWARSVPLARFTQAKPAASSALASLAPPLAMCDG